MMGSSQSATKSDQEPNKSKSLYQKYQEKKGPKPISDEDILKYTGKTRAEINDWADTQPGVGKNQLAGKISIGNTSGLAGAAAAGGFGGWGPSAEPQGPNRGMKFPPKDLEGKPKLVDE